MLDAGIVEPARHAQLLERLRGDAMIVFLAPRAFFGNEHGIGQRDAAVHRVQADGRAERHVEVEQLDGLVKESARCL